MTSFVVCFAQCWPCQLDQHYDPPRWHTWADDEDVAYAESTGRPDPRESRCGCGCAEAAEAA